MGGDPFTGYIQYGEKHAPSSEKFWMLHMYNERYRTLQEAQEAARKILKIRPNEDIFILEAVQKAEVNTVQFRSI
jgi:hypothetical protein